MNKKLAIPAKTTTPMKAHTYRMDEAEQAAADKECKRIYKVSLSTFLRTLILDHFPNAKPKPKQ